MRADGPIPAQLTTVRRGPEIGCLGDSCSYLVVVGHVGGDVRDARDVGSGLDVEVQPEHVAPWEASSDDVAAPRPEAAPVTIAVVSSISMLVP